MIVGIHQPQYIPWLPYFLKIERSDVFILLDSVDFQKNGLQNRNQIKTGSGSHWLTIPVSQKSQQKIINIDISNETKWLYKHWQTIQQSYSKAKYFKAYESELESIYLQEWKKLCDINIEIIIMMMNWMGIKTPLLRSSEMKVQGFSSELILNLCKEVGAKSYLSGSGGDNYLDSESFAKQGIEIISQPSISLKKYPQANGNRDFLADLSALDIILNCGDMWRKYLPSEVIDND